MEGKCRLTIPLCAILSRKPHSWYFLLWFSQKVDILLNESLALVQKQLGHHIIQMTVGIYGHLDLSAAKLDLEPAFEEGELLPSDQDVHYIEDRNFEGSVEAVSKKCPVKLTLPGEKRTHCVI